MASRAKIEANRRNAQHSTGPKTPGGKSRSSGNAAKHGLLARRVLLPAVPAGELAAFIARLRTDLQPEGELEDLLFERIVTATWRLRRTMRLDAEIEQLPEFESLWSEAGAGVTLIHDRVGRFEKLCRYETTLERYLYRALAEFRSLQVARRQRVSPNTESEKGKADSSAISPSIGI